ncbi:MAG TPA: GNAT family N-acetyltransferase, partial [Gemmatimonadales bacterium]
MTAPGSLVFRLNDRPPGALIAALRESVDWRGNAGDYPRAFDGYGSTVAAWDGAALVGWGVVVADGVRQGYLQDVIVHPAHQRRGIGRALVSRLIDGSRNAGLTLLHVDYAPMHQRFYRACGFTMGGGGFLELDRLELPRPGALYALIGSSGSGKTTLLRRVVAERLPALHVVHVDDPGAPAGAVPWVEHAVAAGRLVIAEGQERPHLILGAARDARLSRVNVVLIDCDHGERRRRLRDERSQPE